MPQFPASLLLSGLNGTNGFKITGQYTYYGLGFALAAAGDVNGDGIDDFAIGNASGNGVFVIYGTTAAFGAAFDLDTLDGSNGFHIHTQGSGDGFGRWVSAGDVNGDGFSDVIVTAVSSAKVVFGSASPFPLEVNLNGGSLNGTNGFSISGYAGDTVVISSAGDLNGDGYSDIVVGEFRGDTNDPTNQGRSFVVFGKAGGWTSTVDVTTLDGNNGFRLDGVAAEENTGGSVASAGDINNDGFGDLIIGRGFSVNNNDSGHAYVVFGKAGGYTASMSLSSLDGSNGFKLNGANVNDLTGFSVASAGDVNADGYADLAIGATGADPNGVSAGSTYIVFGKASGYTAAINLSGLNGTDGFRIDGVASALRLGYPVSSAGDVNGDGFDDVIVGARSEDFFQGGNTPGRAYLIFGAASGFGATVSVSSLDGDNGFALVGEGGADWTGIAATGIGDINNDGLADISVGASGLGSGSDFQRGFTYVIYGTVPNEAVNRTGTAIANKIFGGAFNDTLSGLGGDDTLKGGAGDDIIDGGTHATRGDTADLSDATGALNLTLDASGNATVSASGSGSDTLIAIENVIGGSGSDILVANDAANRFDGGGGNDVIYTLEGDDTAIGGAGTDVIVLGLGADSADAGADNDYIYAGDGNDTINGGDGIDVLLGEAGDDSLNGDAGNDYFYGGIGTNTMNGGDGDDVFISEGNADTLDGGSGHNFFYIFGTGATSIFGGDDIDEFVGGVANSDDAFTGGGGQDYAYGGNGNDSLAGGLNNDVLIGQNGNDTLAGGAGVNLIWANDTGNDQVLVGVADGSQTQVVEFFAAGGTDDVVRLLGSSLTSFADYEALLANVGNVVGSNLLVNAGSGAQLYLNLGASQTAIWFQGVSAYSLTASDFVFG